jgi:hypothetical protein
MSNYLKDLMHCLRPDTDEHELDAFVLDEDTSEHSPLNLDLEMNRFNTETDD